MGFKYDFAGWASKNDIRCSDGRTIRRDAFKECDGKIVPLVFMHNHKDINNVLGHALLENRKDGIYAYGSFNDSEDAQIAKEAVRHGDLTALSIYANQLKERNGNVTHGRIREVSLVLAGANDGAVIEFPVIEHADGSMETDWDADEAVIYPNEQFDDIDGGELEDDFDEDDSIEHAETEEKEVAKEGGQTRDLETIIGSLAKEDQEVVYAAFNYAVQHASELKNAGGGEENDDEDEGGEAEHFDMEEDDMRYNVFEGQPVGGDSLTHAEMDALTQDVFEDVRRNGGKLKEAFLAHAAEYGIESIDYLFPEAKVQNGTIPEFINYNQEWVDVILKGVKHTPMSKIKMQYADITGEEARARGYTKGNRKLEEVFGLLRRETQPCTIYKKQKMDRDDIIDITDFDVVAWIKSEMRLKLDEEIARAILFGDGRSTLSQDKIKEDCIRPIVKEDPLFCITKTVATGKDDDETAKNIIRAAIKAQDDYRGTGQPIMFMKQSLLSDMLLLEDADGHDLYPSKDKLTTKMLVSRIVTIPTEVWPDDIYCIIVNLADYTVGADKGGSINMFEDFDIDYNQEKYLMETRCSGSLTKPYSAVVLKKAN